MKISHSIRFNLEYMLSWFVVRVLRLNIRWCVEIYKDYQVLVHNTQSAESKRGRMYYVLEEMAADAAARKHLSQRSKSRSRSR